MIIVEDRYSGFMSGGLWLAFSCIECMPEEPFCDDNTAISFWKNVRSEQSVNIASDCKIGIGSTPDNALQDYENKYNRRECE